MPKAYTKRIKVWKNSRSIFHNYFVDVNALKFDKVDELGQKTSLKLIKIAFKMTVNVFMEILLNSIA